MNSVRMFMKKKLRYPTFHEAIRSYQHSTNTCRGCSSASTASFPAPATVPEHVLDHMLSSKYLKIPDEFPASYCLDHFGNLLFKNLKLEWWKFVERNEHLHPIKDLEWNSGSDSAYSEENILIKANELTESQGDAVTFICGADDSALPEQRIVIVEKMQFHMLNRSEMELSHLEFIKRIYNHPSRLKVTNSLSEDRKILYNVENASFEIGDTRIINCTEKSKIDGKSIPKAIVTLVDLYAVVFSIVCDSLVERNGRHYLLLHQNLIPVKIMIICEASNVQGRVSQLANELCKMITSWGITCLNGHERGWTTNDADSIGCLFTIIVKDSFPDDGILFLRSISTTLAMHVHVTQLSNVLQRYLYSEVATADN